MFRYLLFINDKYYPVHGMWGCKFKTNDLTELSERAIQYCVSNYGEMIQYYDTQLDKVFDYNRETGFWIEDTFNHDC